MPPIVVGASGAATVELAARVADGVNIRAVPALPELIATARASQRATSFEISVLVDLDPAHPLGGDPEPLAALGVDRRILAVRAPYPRRALAELSTRLADDC